MAITPEGSRAPPPFSKPSQLRMPKEG